MKKTFKFLSENQSSSSSSSQISAGDNKLRTVDPIYANQRLFLPPCQGNPVFRDLIDALKSKDRFYNYSQLFEKTGEAEIQKIDRRGWSLLHYAAKYRKVGAISWLLQRLDVNQQTKHTKSTPLMILIQELSLSNLSEESFVDVLKLLIQASNPLLKNIYEMTDQTLAENFANFQQIYNKEKFLTLFHPSRRALQSDVVNLQSSTSDYSYSVLALIAKPKPYYSYVAAKNNAGGGYAENRGLCTSQENAIVIDGNIELNVLNPKQIRERLWSTIRILDRKLPPEFNDESTVAAVVCDIERHLITGAFAGDSHAFVALYNKSAKVIAVKRLNEMVNKPTHPLEKAHIKSVGGQMVYFKGAHLSLLAEKKQNIQDMITVSRDIGDQTFKLTDPHIYQMSFEKLTSDCDISMSDISKIQIICTCAGYTSAAGPSYQSKEDHEALLLQHLQKLTRSAANIDEETLAGALTKKAIKKGSLYNVSVAIQTIQLNDSVNLFKSFFIGLFDGHNGSNTSCYLAENFGLVLREQCVLPQEKYQEKGTPGSVYENKESRKAFFRDNQQIGDLFAHAPDSDIESQEQGKQELSVFY